jgi:(p)ppGpp synthase/HD superfamily hydrolase
MDPTAADLARAIAVAATAHAEQIDKAGQPYILHPIRVMQHVREHGVLAQTVAVLHDVVEDTWVTLDILRSMGYSDEVVDGVDAVTRREGEEYFRYIERCAQHPAAALVKLADLADNSDPIRAFEGSGGLIERYGKARRIVEDAIASRTHLAPG